MMTTPRLRIAPTLQPRHVAVRRAFAVTRLLATPALLLARGSAPGLALVLLALDLIDCAGARVYVCVADGAAACVTPQLCGASFEYQALDKALDAVQYAVALALLGGVGCGVRQLLWALLAWRCVGVALFGATRDPRVLVPFVDAVKEVMVVGWALAVWRVGGGWTAVAALAGTVVAKAGFEVWKNGRRVQWADSASSPTHPVA